MDFIERLGFDATGWTGFERWATAAKPSFPHGRRPGFHTNGCTACASKSALNPFRSTRITANKKSGPTPQPPDWSASQALPRSPSRFSPALSQRFGVLPMPTPTGRTMETISPGSNGVIDEMYSISSGTVKTSSRVFEFCSVSPSMLRLIESSCGSAISSAVTIAGPMGQNVGKLLASDHCDVET